MVGTNDEKSRLKTTRENNWSSELSLKVLNLKERPSSLAWCDLLKLENEMDIITVIKSTFRIPLTSLKFWFHEKFKSLLSTKVVFNFMVIGFCSSSTICCMAKAKAMAKLMLFAKKEERNTRRESVWQEMSKTRQSKTMALPVCNQKNAVRSTVSER